MTCEEKLALLERENAMLQTDIGNLEVALRSERRAKQLLKNQLSKLKTTDPGAQVVRGLLEDWQRFTGHERSDIRLDGERADRVRWALKSRDEEYVRQVFRAGGMYPYVWGSPARRMPYGLKTQRYDDVTTLLKNERAMERLHALLDAEVPDERLVQVPARVIDAMKARNDRAVWAAQVWREQAQANDELVASLAAKLDRPRLRVVA